MNILTNLSGQIDLLPFMVDVFPKANVMENSHNQEKGIKKADVAWFTGGEDVWPPIYGHEVVNSHYSERRDARDISLYVRSHSAKLKVGICRGSQFLYVMNGGSLIQNINAAHGPSHPLVFLQKDGSSKKLKLEATSTHHQSWSSARQLADFRLLSVAPVDFRQVGLFPYDKWRLGVGEIGWFSKTRCLLIQGHPEYTNSKDNYWKLCKELILEAYSKFRPNFTPILEKFSA